MSARKEAKMTGWILYKRREADLTDEDYEARRFLQVAGEVGVDVRLLTPDQFDLVVTRDDRRGVLLDGRTVPLPDFILPRMGAGTTYFALAVIRHLERLGVQSVNSSQSIETVKDKLYTQQILAQSNLPFAKTMLARFPVDVDQVERQLGLPVVVKTVSGSYGSGVHLCRTRPQLTDILQLVTSANRSATIILQEFIRGSRGRDLRVIVIGGRPVCAMLRRSTDGSFKANISRGGAGKPFQMTPRVGWLATEVSRLLGLDVAGIDLLFHGDSYRVCEANSSPGFQGLESCTDIDMPRQIYAFAAVRAGKLDLVDAIHSKRRRGRPKRPA